MKSSDYIFTGIKEQARNLPCVSKDWKPSMNPISMRNVGRLLKRYTRLAGIDPTQVRVHDFRHGAAMMMREIGADVVEISRFLDHSNYKTTGTYLHFLEGKDIQRADQMTEFLGL